MVLLELQLIVQETGIADGDGRRRPSKERPARPIPDANGNGHGTRPVRDVGGEGNDLLQLSISVSRSFRRGLIGSLLLRRAAVLTNQSPVGEKLVAIADYGYLEREGRVMGGQHDSKPVPRKAAIPFVALIGCRLVGAQQLPRGVVEARLGPAELAVGVVAGVETQKALELGHLYAGLLKVKDRAWGGLGTSKRQNRKS